MAADVLTEEQKQEIANYYNDPKTKLQGKFFGKLTLDEYTQLWTTDFGTVLKNKRFPDLQKALKSPKVADGLTALLGINPSIFGGERLYDYVIERIQDRTLGDILKHREEIVSAYMREKAEIASDLADTEHLGKKWDDFSYASNWNFNLDEDKEHFFYRFWRSPLQKLLDYRKIDASKPEGVEEAARITERLFGESVADYPLDQLVTEWPEHLVENKDEIKEKAKKYQEQKDAQYLIDHPDASFRQFLKARRNIDKVDLINQPIAQNALAWLLQTKKADGQAVESVQDKQISDLRNHPENIIADISRRKRKEKTKIATLATIAGMTIIAGLSALYPVVTGVARGVKNAKAAVVEKADGWFNKPAATNDISNAAATTSTTNAILAAASTNTVAATQTQSAPVKKSFAIKGNRPIVGRWTGWEDRLCQRRDTTAFQKLLVGEFNDMVTRIQEKGLPFGEQFNPEATSRTVLREHNKIIPSVAPGQTPKPFYLQPQDYDEFMSDLLNFHMNIRDVLNSVPVDKSRLADAQLAAMEAIGPSMGWSIKQQLAMQKKDGPNADTAFNYVITTAQRILQANNIDTNDVESVFWATMAAAKNYRQANPGCNYLLLTADKAIRSIAGIELQNTAQFEQLSKTDRNEAKRYIAQADAEAKAAYHRTRQSQRPSVPDDPGSKRNIPWGWIGIAVAVTAYMGSIYWKEKGKVVR